MGSALTTIALPVALGIIMLGLGLTLTLGDFARIARHPKAVVIALVCQLLLLPAICFGLVLAFQLPPVLAVGMLLLAASPGGTTANLYSHLFRGDVALNIHRELFFSKRGFNIIRCFQGFFPQGHLGKLGRMLTRMGMGQEQHVVYDRRHTFKLFQIRTQ